MGKPFDPRFSDPITAEIDKTAALIRRSHGHITALQSRQLAWLKRWARTEKEERLRLYCLECHDCGVVEQQHVAAMMAQMIHKHAGHSTWLRMHPGSRYPRGW